MPTTAWERTIPGRERPPLDARGDARFRFLAGKMGREELLAEQRQIFAERKAISHRGRKGYVFAGQYATEWGPQPPCWPGTSWRPDARMRRWPS